MPGPAKDVRVSWSGIKADGMASELARIAAENRRRVKCPHCVLMILPEGMEKHIRICHQEA